MTLGDLSQLYWLRKEIQIDQDRIKRLEDKAQPGAQNLNGMPRGGGDSDKTAALAIEIADLRTAVEAKQRACVRELKRLEDYIAGIQDSMTRQIFTLRFVEGMSWQGVATRMGGKNSADGVRMTVRRYLEKPD